MNTFRHLLLSITLYSLFFLGAGTAHAASLSFSNAAQYSVGAIVSVPVLLSTAGNESANAVSAKVTFPSDLLTLVSVSKAGSIITLWPEEPQFSQSNGSAQFEGVILNPGWNGSSGTVLTLTFKAKANGTGALVFTDASVLANDGQGTNILSAAPAHAITIASPAPPAPVVAGPPAPRITSSTYPDQTHWYRSKKGIFSWTVSPSVTAVRILYDRIPDSIPTVEYTPPISQKKISVPVDGIYYFHAQFKTALGWGSVGHFTFQVDTTPPIPPNIRLAHSGATTDPRPILLFNTTDNLSGIDHYNVQIDNARLLTFSAESVQSNPYASPWEGPGDKNVTVAAFDKAENVATSSTVIHIDTIDVPTVTEYSSDLNQGDLLRIRGTTYPGATVTITLKDSQGVVSADTAIGDNMGGFSFIWIHALPPGIYAFTVSAVDTRGGVSNTSSSYSVRVKTVGAGLFSLSTISFSVFGIAIVTLLLLLAVAMLYLRGMPAWLSGRRASSEHCEHDEVLFLDELVEERKLLEKAAHHRTLTKEEEIILEHIKIRMKSLKRDLA